MRTETIIKQVFSYDELSEAAKENARIWYREGGLDYEWYDAVFEDAKYCADLLGIDIDNIYFSGFSCQGDGALFEGDYAYRKGWRKALKQSVGGDDLSYLLEIGQCLQDAQKKVFYLASATTSQNGHYSHSGCMSVDVSVEDHHNGYWGDTCEAEQDITDALRLFADWIYDKLEKEYDYLNSDESAEEAILANDYEFDEDGNIH